MQEIATKAALAGSIGGALSYALFDMGDVTIAGSSFPAALVVAAGIAAGSATSDVISEYIIERSDLPRNVKSTEELLIRLGVTGLAGTGVLMLAGSTFDESLAVFTLAATSKYAGDYANDLLFGAKGIIAPLF